MKSFKQFNEATAREKFLKAQAERDKEAKKREAEMNARHAAGKEDMSGAINRLSQRLNKEEVELEEAKIGDKVQVVGGSQKGIVGHVGEIRKGLGGTNHTYTVDYEEGGKRQSVQVKKAHTKLVKESSDEHELGIANYDAEDKTKSKHIGDVIKSHGGKVTGSSDKSVYVRFPADKVHEAKKKLEYHGVKTDHWLNGQMNEASIYSTSMPGRGKVGMVGKKPNASDMATYGEYHVTVKHEGGEKTYKLKDMKDSRHASNVAMKLHDKDNPGKKIKDVSYKKV